MKRLAEVEKILIQTDEEIEKQREFRYSGLWRTFFKETETNALKSQAYDKIHKLLLEDE